MNLITIDEINNLNFRKIKTLYKRYYNAELCNLLNYMDMDKNFTVGRGVEVIDDNGTKYLDFLGGFGALNLGHNPEFIKEEIKKVSQYPNLLQSFINSYEAVLSHNLNQVLSNDFSYFFFTNSGTETVEEAIKLSLLYNKGGKIIYFDGAYHGKTMGSLLASDISEKESYKITSPKYLKCEFNNFEELSNLCENDNVACIILEPVQGEGGMRSFSKEFLKSVRNLCYKEDIILVFDEIQTGLGRTGTLFNYQSKGVIPDILCISKSLGGGIMPIGCIAVEEKFWSKTYGKLKYSTYLSSTFGGNTLACAAAISTINYISNNNIVNNANELGKYTLQKLKAICSKSAIIQNVRGEGLMIGIEFKSKINNLPINEYMISYIISQLLNKYHIITGFCINSPKVLRVEPPLIVNKEQIDYFLESFSDILKDEKSLIKIILKSSAKTVKNLIKG